MIMGGRVFVVCARGVYECMYKSCHLSVAACDRMCLCRSFQSHNMRVSPWPCFIGFHLETFATDVKKSSENLALWLVNSDYIILYI